MIKKLLLVTASSMILASSAYAIPPVTATKTITVNSPNFTCREEINQGGYQPCEKGIVTNDGDGKYVISILNNRQQSIDFHFDKTIKGHEYWCNVGFDGTVNPNNFGYVNYGSSAPATVSCGNVPFKALIVNGSTYKITVPSTTK